MADHLHRNAQLRHFDATARPTGELGPALIIRCGVLKQDASGQWVWRMDPAYTEWRVKRGAPVRPVLWPALETLQCPTVVIWGTESDVLSETQARRMAQTLPNGKLVPVPRVGHAPILTEPAALVAIEQVLGK